MARVDVLAKRNGSGIVGGAPRSATCIPPCGAYAESRRCLKVVRLLSMLYVRNGSPRQSNYACVAPPWH